MEFAVGKNPPGNETIATSTLVDAGPLADRIHLGEGKGLRTPEIGLNQNTPRANPAAGGTRAPAVL